MKNCFKKKNVYAIFICTHKNIYANTSATVQQPFASFRWFKLWGHERRLQEVGETSTRRTGVNLEKRRAPKVDGPWIQGNFFPFKKIGPNFWLQFARFLGCTLEIHRLNCPGLKPLLVLNLSVKYYQSVNNWCVHFQEVGETMVPDQATTTNDLSRSIFQGGTWVPHVEAPSDDVDLRIYILKDSKKEAVCPACLINADIRTSAAHSRGIDCQPLEKYILFI